MRKKMNPPHPTQVLRSYLQRLFKIGPRRRNRITKLHTARSVGVQDTTLQTAALNLKDNTFKGNVFKATATGAVSRDTAKQTVAGRTKGPQTTTTGHRDKTSTWKTWSRKSLRWPSPTS